ncbi:alpha/beta fold hydrolase [Candidatus Uhrbacteria bacterium]|nr:alpha/beta fold hydrolase [Candidatus Uhrbacteria bacterium]
MRVDLQKITTRDAVVLAGGVVLPKRHGKTAVILVHGLMGKFYGWLPRMEPLVAGCVRQGMAVALFNTRGHDVVSTISTVAPRQARGRRKSALGGSATERFEDCVYDIRAVIDFLSKIGYRRIIFAGHSTGANKVAYYQYKTKDRRVKKIVLLSPISDPAVARREYGDTLKAHLKIAKQAVRKGDGEKFLMSTPSDPLLTPKRFLSLYTPGGAEDVFPYYNPKGNWRAMESIRIPLLAVVGDHDQFLDRDAREYMEAFQKHVRDFRGTIIAGADHSFNKREKQLARAVVRFIRA